MDVVFTNYPLSAGYADRLSQLLGPDPVWLNLGQLRRQSFRRLLLQLRSLKANRLFLALEDQNSEAILPVLKLIAAVTPAKNLLVVDSNLKINAFSRLAILESLARLGCASAKSYLAVRRARRQAFLLAREPRVSVGPEQRRHMMFLNANLWFGVKAGGSIGHISGVVNAFLAAGYEVDYLSVGGRLLVKDPARYMPVTPPKDFGVPWDNNLYAFHFKAVKQADQFCRTSRPSFIYQRLSVANYTGVTLSRRHRLPLILEYNGSEAWVARNWGRPLRHQSLAEDIEAICLRHAHLVVTISEVLKAELLERGVPAERIVCYPNCIDPEIYAPERYEAADVSALRIRYGIGEDAVVATFVGTFGMWHGAERFAQAARDLLDGNSLGSTRKVHFLFVGDGLKMPDVRSILGPCAKSGRVTLTGLVAQHETPLYLAASDIFVSPHVPNADGSRFFGSPTKLFEYMAMGKAILASDLDQIGEVLRGSLRVDCLPTKAPEAGESAPALLAEPGSAAELKKGLRFLTEHEEWRRVLGENARRLALTNYTWADHVRAILRGAQKAELIVDDAEVHGAAVQA